MKILAKKILRNHSHNYKNKNQTEKMMNKNYKILTLNNLLFLQMKIYKDQVCHNKVKYLADMVQYGTKNLPVQQDVREKNILSTKPGTKRFILARVNDEKDVFQELWGHQNFENVMHLLLLKREGKEMKHFFCPRTSLPHFLVCTYSVVC